MKNILTPILLIAGIFAGVMGANFLKGAPAEPVATEVAEHEKDDHAGDDHAKADGYQDEKSDKKKSDKSKKDKGKSSKAKSGYGGSDVTYYKFTREFIVPLMHDSEIESLVILNINLEVDSTVSSSLFSQEPKLRDNIMTTLIQLSNDGVTLDQIGSVESYETVRSMVLDNLRDVLGDGILNVLIVDMAKQDV